MKKEAELHVAEDQRKRELSEAKNAADNLIYATEKTLREAGDKISSDLKKEIEEKVGELKKAKEGDNINEIKNKTSDLSQVIQKVGAQMYRRASSEEPKKEKPKKEKPEAEEGEYKEK